LRGYFGIGIEGVSKPMNLGALFRTAHAFGASFVFSIAPHEKVRNGLSDTSKSLGHIPYFEWGSPAEMAPPAGCKLVAVELCDEAEELPSFHHPQQACYILGPERGEVSKEVLELADHVVSIPTKFCINVGLAGALVMYDRTLHLGRFAERPLMEGQAALDIPEHTFGSHIPRSVRQAQKEAHKAKQTP